MYSWKPQHGGDRIYFFIEFKDASAVERALKITAEGVKVHRLASSPPHLISNFSAIQPMLYLKRSNAQSTNGQNLPGSQAEENSMPVGHKRRRVSSGVSHPLLSSVVQRHACQLSARMGTKLCFSGLLKRILAGCRSDETQPR